jgi:hypothetical protein
MVDVIRFRWGREAKGDLLRSSLVTTWPNLRLEVALVTGCVALDLIVAGGVQSGRASDSRRRSGSRTPWLTAEMAAGGTSVSSLSPPVSCLEESDKGQDDTDATWPGPQQ